MFRIERLNNLHVYLVHINQLLSSLSELKPFFQSFVQNFFCSILHFKGTNYGFFSQISLNLNFRILLPTSYVFWHIKFNLLFQEIIHLLLYRIWFSIDDESTSIIDTGHLIEIFVSISEAPHDVELSIENVLSVASILNSIVNNQLNHNFLSLVTME